MPGNFFRAFCIEVYLLFFFEGTFKPFSLASEIPMAMACFLFVTFFPEEDFSFPSLNSCITSPTLS